MDFDVAVCALALVVFVTTGAYSVMLFREVGQQTKRERELTRLRERVRKMRGLSL